MTDTPRHEWTGVLPSSSPLARSPFGCTSRGSLSRSVFLLRRRRGCFPVPQGTCECFCQDVQRCVLISVQDHTTAGTDVGTHTERLLDHRPTDATFLAGELWCYCNDRDSVHQSIGFHPGDKCPPACIVNTLGEMMVLDHIAYLKLLIGN